MFSKSVTTLVIKSLPTKLSTTNTKIRITKGTGMSEIYQKITILGDFRYMIFSMTLRKLEKRNVSKC